MQIYIMNLLVFNYALTLKILSSLKNIKILILLMFPNMYINIMDCLKKEKSPYHLLI